MFKSKMMVFVLLALTFTASLAYCQGKAETRQIKTISGMVSNVDEVGNIIEVTTNEGQMSFSVPNDAIITEGTEKIGLIDIETDNYVTIRYYNPSPAEFVVVSIAYK